jgi:hypothetical protein
MLGTRARYLVEAEQALPKDKRPDHPVTGFLQRIGKLFAIESHTLKMKPEQRQQVRAEQSQPLLAEIETMLLQHLHTVLPQSLFGKALHYLPWAVAKARALHRERNLADLEQSLRERD